MKIEDFDKAKSLMAQIEEIHKALDIIRRRSPDSNCYFKTSSNGAGEIYRFGGNCELMDIVTEATRDFLSKKLVKLNKELEEL